MVGQQILALPIGVRIPASEHWHIAKIYLFKTYVLENGLIALSGGKEILENPKIRNIYFGGR